MKGRLTALWAFGALVALICSMGVRAADISRPLILVATERWAGSPYQETVVLAVPSGDGQHLGLIVNRPTSIDLASMLPEPKAVKTALPLFFGGPVMTGSLFAAVRASEPPSAYSVPLMPGLYLVTDENTVGRLVKGQPDSARYFTGFVVWEANELAEELRDGMWQVQPADAKVLFQSDPQQLWIEYARNRQVAWLGDIAARRAH